VIRAGVPPRLARHLLVALVAVLHAGCAPLYVTPQSPPETLAVLEGAEYRTGPGWGTPWLFQAGVVSIVDVDGARPDWRGSTRQVTLRAGLRTITARYERFPLRAVPVPLAFAAEGGHRYRVEAAEQGPGVILWIVDAATGQSVTTPTPGGRLEPVR
jgi:hypothetical protein